MSPFGLMALLASAGSAPDDARPVGAVGGHPELGVEPVEGLFAGRLGCPLVVVVDPVVGVRLEGLGGQLVVG